MEVGKDSVKQQTEMESIIMMLEEIVDHMGTNTSRYRQILSKLDSGTLESEQPSDAPDEAQNAPSTHIARIKSLGHRIHSLNSRNSEILEPLEKII